MASTSDSSAVAERPAHLFKPGQSGNPGGRKRQDHKVTELAQAHCEEMIRVLVSVANDEDYAINSRVRAAEIVLNRGLGMPRQAVEFSSENGQGLNLVVEIVSGELPALPASTEDAPPATLDEVRAEHAERRGE